jgi:hypothetical protein
MLCIESTSRGFSLIDIQEVERSAQERFGVNRVTRSTVTDSRGYLSNANWSVTTTRPEAYWIDPRSGSQRTFQAIFQSIGLAVLLAWHGVTPIVWLTDADHRRWRLQSEILSAGSGVTFVLENPTTSPLRFAHGRFYGPVPMPLSSATLNQLDRTSTGNTTAPPSAVFVGSLYEPRTTFIGKVQEQLAQRGYALQVHARRLGGRRIPDDEYWRRLVEADVVFTTATHADSERGTDKVETPHLVYRYTEALAAGSALVAPLVPGSEHVFAPGQHYAGYTTEEEAVSLIISLLESAERRQEMADAGRARVAELLRESTIWTIVESLLWGGKGGPSDLP